MFMSDGALDFALVKASVVLLGTVAALGYLARLAAKLVFTCPDKSARHS